MDDYFIDPDDYAFIDDLCDEDAEEILKVIEDRNNEVEGPLAGFFEKAIGCSVFVSFGPTVIGSFQVDDALIEKLGDTADEFMLPYYLMFFDEDECEEDDEEE